MQAEATCRTKVNCSYEHAQKKKHTLPDTRAHTNTFTLCLCGLGEPAKLSFLLLSEVSQRDPLVLPTCSSHSQTAEEAVSQYRAERGGYGKRQLQYKLQYRHSYHVQKSYKTSVYDTVKSSWHNRLTAKAEPGLDYVVLLQQK